MTLLPEWIAAHRSLIDAIGVDSLLGLSAWILLACGRISAFTGALAAVGAYASAEALSKFHVPFAAAALAGACGGAIAGYLGGIAIARGTRTQFALATFCAAELCALSVAPARIAPHPVAPATWFIWLAVAACFAAAFALLRSKVGRAMRAVAGDERAAESIGIDVASTVRIALAISGFFGGFGGALAAALVGARADFGLRIDLDALASAFVGGGGSALGPLAGIIALRAAGLAFGAAYQNIVNAAALIVCALLLPGGLVSVFRFSGADRAAAAERSTS